MDISKSLIDHKITGDFHDSIDIYAGQPGVGGAPCEYLVKLPNNKEITVKFQSKCITVPDDVDGLTNEILLTIIQDRLESFQTGPSPCDENDRALINIKLALVELQQRSRRLMKLNKDIIKFSKSKQKMSERITKDDEYLYIGDGKIDFKTLETWAGWYNVESAVKKLIKDSVLLTGEELELIKSCAVTSGGKNGYAEFKAAYAQMI